MLSRQFVREHTEAVREALALRGTEDVDLDAILEADEEWRDLKARGDDLRHQRNEVSSEIGDLKQAGKEEEAQEAIERSQELKAEIQEVEDRAEDLDAELTERLLEVPNVPQEDVPPGEDESDNEEVRRVGFAGTRDLPAEVTPHYDLGEDMEILDFERGAKVTGGGFYFLKGDGARLEHALVQFMRDIHREQGYTEVFPPIPVTSESMRGTGQLPKFNEDAYRVGGAEHDDYDDDDLWLCPTAEVPVTNMYRDDILLADDLPIKHQAYTPGGRPANTAPKPVEWFASTSSTRWNWSTSSNPTTATTDWRHWLRRPRTSCAVSTFPTGSSSSVAATSRLPPRRPSTSRCGRRPTTWTTDPTVAAAGWKSPRPRTSRRSRPAALASGIAQNVTSPPSICTP
jgi:hypothetical protein